MNSCPKLLPTLCAALIAVIFGGALIAAAEDGPAKAPTSEPKQQAPAAVDAKPIGAPEAMAKVEAAEIERLAKLAPEEVEKTYAGKSMPEAVKMLVAIARGSQMSAGEGWFGPAQSHYTWEWLAKAHGVATEGSIPADFFQGSKAWFARLDRNQDGRIAAEDLDWSQRSSWVRQASVITGLLRRMDPDSDGKLSRKEWSDFFDVMAGSKDSLEIEELRDALLAGETGSFESGDVPTKEVLIEGLKKGEIGSLQEGPAIDAAAPDFTLKTFDGMQTIHLADVIGSKPVVLVFGNYTCGPFRSLYRGVDKVCKKYEDQATFLAVYVREAHPTDGWHMESNDRAGVKIGQPKTYDERVSAAHQCRELLKPSMPLLVDEITDPVGNTYSGMPARLYVIDCAGKVVYKSGRGPFGFKAGEMEQALVMTLLDRAMNKADD